MAFTKVTAAGIGTTQPLELTGVNLAGVVTATGLYVTGISTFTGNVSIAGTLTYEDVTNIDAVGLITARAGIEFGTRPGLGASISDIGNAVFAGVVTATSYYGDGSNLTGIDATQIVTGNTSVQTVDTGSDGHIKFTTEGSEVSRFDSSGRFGLGTASPTNPLHISSSDGTPIKLQSSGANTYINFVNSSNGQGYIGYETQDMVFWTANSEKARIDSSGRLLVGTSSAPSSSNQAHYGKLIVSGNSANNTHCYASFITGSTAATQGAEISRFVFGNTDAEYARLDVALDGTAASGSAPGRMVFYTTASGATSPTERLRITNNGTLQLRNSPGIDFSQIQTNATGMTSETLDSYEEGTWTPQLVNQTGGTFSNQKGRYTKIGRLVHLKGFLQTSTPTTFSNTSANFTIGGLPFNPDNNNAGYGMVSGSMTSQSLRWLGAGMNGNNVTSGQVVPALGVVSSITGVQFWVFANNDVQSTVLNNAQHNRDWIVQFEVTYHAGS